METYKGVDFMGDLTDDEIINLIQQHELHMYKELNKALFYERQTFLKNIHIILRDHDRLA